MKGFGWDRQTQTSAWLGMKGEEAGRPLRKLLPELRCALSCLAWGERGKNRVNSLRKMVTGTQTQPQPGVSAEAVRWPDRAAALQGLGGGGDGGANPGWAVQARLGAQGPPAPEEEPPSVLPAPQGPGRPSAMAREPVQKDGKELILKTREGRLYRGRTRRAGITGDLVSGLFSGSL